MSLIFPPPKNSNDEALVPRISECDPIGDRVFTDDQVKGTSLGWGPDKRANLELNHRQGEQHVKMRREI